MKDARRVIQLRSYALAFAVALSPAFFQITYSCARGNTFVLSLELEVSGQDQIANFSTTTRSYAVTIDSSTATVRVVTQDPSSIATYRWFVDGTAIGPAIAIGTGGGEVTATVPVGESELYVNVQAPEGAFDSYIIAVTNLTDAVTETIIMDCNSDIFALCGAINPCVVGFELTVDPLWTVAANQSFDAESTGYASLPDELLNGWGVLGGVVPHRAALVGGTVPVVVKSGATGPDVNLQLAPTEWTCAVDASGNFGPGVGPYPSCDPANDIPVQDPATGLFANTDCVGVNGIDPDPINPCAAFVELTVVDGVGDACAACSFPGGIGSSKFQLCELTGSCATLEPLAFPLSAEIGSYTAETDPEAGFGFTPPSGSPPPLQFVAQYPGAPVLGATGLFADSTDCTDNHPFGSVSIDVRDWRGPEIISHDPGPDNAFQVDLAVNDDGSAVAVWVLDGGTSAPDSIYANVLTAGVWGTPELLATAATNPQVAVAPNGDALAVWSQVDTSSTIYGVRLIAGVWGTPDLISAGSGIAGNPRVGMDDNGNALVVWVQPDGPAVPSLYANQLTSGAWGTPVLVETDNTVFSVDQEISVAPNGDAVVVWLATDGLSIFNIYANRLVSGTWVGPGLLDTVTDPDPFDGDLISLGAPTVSVNGNGDAVAAWASSDCIPGFPGCIQTIGSNIYTSQLTSGTWGAPVAVPLEAGESQPGFPQVAIYPDGDAVVGYKGNDAWANQLTSGTWGPAVRLDTTSVAQPLDIRVAASSNGDAVAVWRENFSRDIYANRLTGGVWTGPVLLEGSTENAFEPSVGLDSNGNAVAAFSQSDGTIRNIYANVFE